MIGPRRVLWHFCITTSVAASAFTQSVPVLQYNPPPNFYHGAGVTPDQFSSNEVDAGLQLYPFRPFRGDLRQVFQQTLHGDVQPQ
jgi:hypothetical protein